MTISGDWLDGPKFVEWLDERRAIPRRRGRAPVGAKTDPRLTDNDKRRIQDWKLGSAVNYYTADALVVRLGLGPLTFLNMTGDLPDDVEAEVESNGYRPIHDRRRNGQQHAQAGQALVEPATQDARGSGGGARSIQAGTWAEHAQGQAA